MLRFTAFAGALLCLFSIVGLCPVVAAKLHPRCNIDFPCIVQSDAGHVSKRDAAASPALTASAMSSSAPRCIRRRRRAASSAAISFPRRVSTWAATRQAGVACGAAGSWR